MSIYEDRIIKPFEETLLFSDYSDTLVDYAEIPLDKLGSCIFKETAQGFLELPIIKGVVALGKLGWSIQRAVVLRNQLTFIQSLKKKTPDPDAVEKRRQALKKNEKWIAKEIETTLIYLERFADSCKAKYQANLYKDLLEQKISFSHYTEYITILDNLMVSDIEYYLDLVDYCIRNGKSEFSQNSISDDNVVIFNFGRCIRLEHWGLLRGIITPTMGASCMDRFIIPDYGLYLYTIFLDDKDNKHIRFTTSEDS